ncbi:MAG: HlyD family secretion protein [Pseudomonadota bacterium]
MRSFGKLLALFPALVLAACGGDSAQLPGTVEWDRVAVLAESAEPVVAVLVHEGDRVQAGQPLLTLDSRRTEAQLAMARAERDAAAARLLQLRNGTRIETVTAARADLERAQTEADNAVLERRRQEDLRVQNLVAQSALDRTVAAERSALAQVKAARARLDEALRGARREEIVAAEAALAAQEARVRQLAVTRERLTVTAPRAGRVDALPFRVGDQPPAGATLVSLLAGDAPYARVYVPAPLRARLQPGARFEVRVEGVEEPFMATLRSIRSEPAFTPYYALAGEDASRLVYRAELVLAGAEARQLPAGLPVQAGWSAAGATGDAAGDAGHDAR